MNNMKILENASLKSFNTFGIEAYARAMVSIASLEDLESVLRDPKFANMKMMVWGGGSNMLLTQDFDGLVLRMEVLGKKLVAESENQIVLEVGAGENWHGLVQYCIGQDWGGIENLSLIPGKVGAAPIQNIGAYGVELKDVFESVTFYDLEQQKLRQFNAIECEFGYRDSVFKRALKGKVVILNVSLRLSKSPHALHTSYGAIQDELLRKEVGEPGIREVSDAIIHIRQSKLPDPAVIGNGGSFFKNPELPSLEFEDLKARFPNVPGYVVSESITKVPAAWLIDQAGWKGKRFGNYGVHDRQALVLVNHGGASGKDIYDLSSRIKASVLEKFGVELEREVNIV